MSEIKKVSVDGVIYDIYTGNESSSEEIQVQLDNINYSLDNLNKKNRRRIISG